MFETRDHRHVFIGVTSDAQWTQYCREFDLSDLWADESLRENAGRRKEFAMLTLRTEELVRQFDFSDILLKLEHANIPHAPINTPMDLFEHPHLVGRRHFTTLVAPDGTSSPIPGLPLEFEGVEAPERTNPPRLGEHTVSILRELGYSDADIEAITGDASPGNV